MISKKEALLLELMEPMSKEHYGFTLADRSNGKIWRGSVHVLLGRLCDKGFVTHRKDGKPVFLGGPERTLFRLTEEGRRAWRNHANTKSRLARIIQVMTGTFA